MSGEDAENMNTLSRSFGRRALDWQSALVNKAREIRDRRDLYDYEKSDRRPWRRGYGVYRNRFLADVVHDPSMLELFLRGSLPTGYGFRLDARVIEIPWVLARLANESGRLLDAGSSLNSDFVLRAPALSNKKITIVTLAPEGSCHWQLGISYVFGDLRETGFQDGWFDTIACISTIEHVDMDNSLYAGISPESRAGLRGAEGRLRSVDEMRRLLKPGGRLFITFPYGRNEDHGWFQQLDGEQADMLIGRFAPDEFRETVFRYDPEGWRPSDRASCEQCSFFDVRRSKYFDPASTVEYPPDYPAGERAVMCLELRK